MPTDCRCGRPTRDQAFVCDTCWGHYTRALAEIPFIVDELTVSVARIHAAVIDGGAPSAEHPLPYNPKAADLLRHLHAQLGTWARFCHEEGLHPGDLPPDNAKAISAWLLDCHRLKLHDIAPEAVDEITDTVAEGRRIIFWKRRNRIYLGTCERSVVDPDTEETLVEACPGEVYANDGEDVGHCDECGQGVTVVVWRANLEDRLSGHLATAAEIARLSTYLGLPASRETVRRKVLYWARHKRIQPHTREPEPLYRYGDVRSLLYVEFASRDASA